MPSTYSTRLRLELIADGEQAGTWGSRTNVNLGTLIESAIAGYRTIAMPDTNYTLTTSNGGDDDARYAVLNFTGTLTATRDVVVPAVSKLYVVRNQTSQSINIKTASGSSRTVPSGRTVYLVVDGTNTVDSVDHLTSLTVSGTTSLGVLNVFGAASLGAASATNLSYSGTLTGGTGVVDLGSGQFYKDAAGNVGVGLIPSAWASSRKAVELAGPAFFASAGTDVSISHNMFLNSSIQTIYKTTAAIARYRLFDGDHIWLTAPSGTAGTVATVTERMRLVNPTGNLGIGTASPSTRLHVFAAGTTMVGIIESNQSASVLNFACTGQTSGQPQFGASGSTLILNTNANQRVAIDGIGNFFHNTPVVSYQSGASAIQNRCGSWYTINNLQQRFTFNTYANASGNVVYLADGFACDYRVSEGDGSHSWFTAASGTAGNTVAYGGAKMFLSNAGHFKSSNSGGYGGAGTGDLTASACHLLQNDQNNGVLRLISTNTGSSAATLETYLPTGASANHFTGRVNNVASIQILANGNVQNTNNSYGSISDARLKENVLPAKSYLERFMQVQYKTFNFIGSQAKQFGVIAQEVEGVFPGLVEEVPVFDSEGKDTGETQKTVKYSILAQIQGKVIQEQQAIIEGLANRLVALENLVKSMQESKGW
jgi:hypothetical protein